MNAKKAKKIIEDEQLSTTPPASIHFAYGYMEALREGEEVKALVEVLEKIQISWREGDPKFKNEIDEAIGQYHEAVRK